MPMGTTNSANTPQGGRRTARTKLTLESLRGLELVCAPVEHYKVGAHRKVHPQGNR